MYLKELNPDSLTRLQQAANLPEVQSLVQWLKDSQLEVDLQLRNLEGNQLLRCQGAAQVLEFIVDTLSESEPTPVRAVNAEEEKED